MSVVAFAPMGSHMGPTVGMGPNNNSSVLGAAASVQSFLEACQKKLNLQVKDNSLALESMFLALRGRYYPCVYCR